MLEVSRAVNHLDHRLHLERELRCPGTGGTASSSRGWLSVVSKLQEKYRDFE
jgi:hypothetical protein